MSVELDMQHLNKTIESGDQIIYVKFFYKQKYVSTTLDKYWLSITTVDTDYVTTVQL